MGDKIADFADSFPPSERDGWNALLRAIQHEQNNPHPTFEDIFDDIYFDAETLLIAKQRGYGPENIAQLGFYGVFSRLASDKIERLKNLMNGRIEKGRVVLEWDDTHDESVEDTLFDVMNYAAILIALRRGHWGFPLYDEVHPLDE